MVRIPTPASLERRYQRLAELASARLGTSSATPPEDKLPAEQSLARFVQAAWHVIEPSTPLIWGWHLDAICEHLEAVSLGQLRNLIVTVPPRSSKSTVVSVLWPAWEWVHRAGTRFLTASYALNLSIRDALRSRRVITSSWFWERWGHLFRLSGDQNVKSRYENDRTGFRVSISVDSATTGENADITVIDDAHNVTEAESPAKREATIRWHDEAFFNRLNSPKTGRRVVIGQRVAEGDLIGHLLQQGGWDHLNIPEEFVPSRRCTTSIGWTDPRQQDGELLRPERFGPEEVVTARKVLGTFAYNAQHQQDPVSPTGYRFQRDWLRYFTRKGDFYIVGSKRFEPRQIRPRFLTVDTAATLATALKPDPDYTVVAAWGVTPDGELLWLGCLRTRCEVPDIPGRIGESYERFGVENIYIEGGGVQKGVVQLARKHKLSGGRHMSVIELTRGPKEGKLVRAASAMAVAEAGRLYLPQQDSTFPLDEVVAELLRFTGDPNRDGHDDCVDCLADAARVLVGKDGGEQSNAAPGIFQWGR